MAPRSAGGRRSAPATPGRPSSTARSTSPTACWRRAPRTTPIRSRARPSRARNASSASTRRPARNCGSTNTTRRTPSLTPPARAARRSWRTARSGRSAPWVTCSASTPAPGKSSGRRTSSRTSRPTVPLWGFAAHPLLDGDQLITLVGGKDQVAVVLRQGHRQGAVEVAVRQGARLLPAGDLHARRQAHPGDLASRSGQWPGPGDGQGALAGAVDSAVGPVRADAAGAGRQALPHRLLQRRHDARGQDGWPERGLEGQDLEGRDRQRNAGQDRHAAQHHADARSGSATTSTASAATASCAA